MYEMRPPLSIGADASLTFAVFSMNLMQVDAAGVVDDENRCIGFVTGDDVIDHVCDKGVNAESTYACDVMRPPNVVVYRNDSVDLALMIMDSNKLDWLPVVEPKTQCFSGLICREDLEAPEPVVSFPKTKRLYQFAAANAA